MDGDIFALLQPLTIFFSKPLRLLSFHPYISMVLSYILGETPFRSIWAMGYGLWSFDSKENSAANHMVHTDLSLCIPHLTEEDRRQACVQHRGRCFNYVSTKHSLH